MVEHPHRKLTQASLVYFPVHPLFPTNNFEECEPEFMTHLGTT